MLRSLSLGTSGIGIERVGLNKKRECQGTNKTEKIIIIKI